MVTQFSRLHLMHYHAAIFPGARSNRGTLSPGASDRHLPRTFQEAVSTRSEGEQGLGPPSDTVDTPECTFLHEIHVVKIHFQLKTCPGNQLKLSFYLTLLITNQMRKQRYFSSNPHLITYMSTYVQRFSEPLSSSKPAE